MPMQANTGWRSLAPAGRPIVSDIRETSKEDLFRIARSASEAMELKPASRHILDHIVGCYGGEQIKGLYLVWPSNEFLMERTGLSERAVRYAVRQLIESGILGAKDSANGKRFAIRSKSGQIVDAYGFDLGPMIERAADFQGIVSALKDERRQRRNAFDEITICRRQILEALRFLEAKDGTPVAEEMQRLQEITPRRDSKAMPDTVLGMWRSLKDHTLSVYNTACGGNNDRHIKDNNDAPNQSCSNGFREYHGAEVEIRLSDLSEACPDALAYIGEKGGLSDLVRSAAELRGGFGVHQSAWAEALDLLGRVAGTAFFVTLQIYENDQRGKAQIKNFGGYFRSTVRKIAAGQISLAQEVSALRYRRRN